MKYCDKAQQFTAEEIPSVVLLEMKKTAEAYLDKVTNAVSAVSAYFYDIQRKATIDVGTIAGFNVVHIIN